MKVLGIESSCDDTSVALLEMSAEQINIISEKTASQIEIHKKYGGVVPEIAGRAHAEKIVPLIEAVLENNNRPELITVTSGPGLITGLLVGVQAAKTLSYLWNIPIIGTNHIEGHIYSALLGQDNKIIFPALALIVSGGHTELILLSDHGIHKKIGATVDDAAGECFDKVAKLLGFPYPGGPQISKFASSGDSAAIELPRPMLKENNYNFSFSGLKTAALYYLQDHNLASLNLNPTNLPSGISGIPKNEITINDFCASFEQAIVDVLVYKTIKAAQEFQPKTILLGGGVSANKKLRDTLESVVQEELPNTLFLKPLPKYSMDNAAMIAVAGYFNYLKNPQNLNPEKIIADPNWEL